MKEQIEFHDTSHGVKGYSPQRFGIDEHSTGR